MGDENKDRPSWYWPGWAKALFRQQERMLAVISIGLEKIMADIDVANAAIKKIKDATDEQSVTLAAESASLQAISDDLDALLKNVPPGAIDPALLASLQTAADNVALVSGGISKNADFSKALASKGAPNPVPVPVPAPTLIP